MWISKPSELISKVLSPALRLWLRSQIDCAEELQIKIQGRDRQILRGYIPGVFLNSRQGVYQGLHLGEILLRGENIRVNIGQVLKGKPLQLLEPIWVSGELRLVQSDLQASLASSILANAFTDLLMTLLELNGVANPQQFLQGYQVNWQEITLKTSQFALGGTLTDSSGQTTPINIRAGLSLMNPQTLHLNPIELEILPELFQNQVREFQLDLGRDVELEALALEEEQLFCCGRLTIRP